MTPQLCFAQIQLFLPLPFAGGELCGITLLGRVLKSPWCLWQAGLSPIHLGAAAISDKCHQEPSGAGSAWPAGSWLGDGAPAGAPAPGLDGKAGFGQLLLL